MADGLRSSISDTGVVCATTSEYTWASRTRRAISCAYCAPKSTTSTGPACCCDMHLIIAGRPHNPGAGDVLREGEHAIRGGALPDGAQARQIAPDAHHV